jgi:predicted branched-subunit amino acid permease
LLGLQHASQAFFSTLMRIHLSRPAFFEGVRDMLPALMGIVPFGIVAGVGSVAAGASPLTALAMSLIIFSGAAQIAAAQMIVDGAPFAVIVLTCFVLSLRFLMYSAALAPSLRSLDARWRNFIAFLLTDQAFAATIRRFRESDDLRANVSYYLGSGGLLWVTWALATLLGALLGSVIPPAWELDFAVPLVFIALLAPLLRDRVSLLVFAVAAVAVVGLDALPMRLSLISAGLLAIVAGMLADQSLRPRRG